MLIKNFDGKELLWLLGIIYDQIQRVLSKDCKHLLKAENAAVSF